MKSSAIDAFTRHTASQVNHPIFPERFALGDGLSGAQKLAGAIHRARDDLVTERDSALQFFGGDLDGIVSRLDDLGELGLTGVYLTPIVRAPSNHKHAATDFFGIDPMFGGEPALKRLVVARCRTRATAAA